MSTSFVLVYERYVVGVGCVWGGGGGGGARGGCGVVQRARGGCGVVQRWCTVQPVLSKHLGTSKCLLNLRQMLT